MCGICGIIRFDDAPIERPALERSCAALRHRGPDHADTWIDDRHRPGVGLGVVRLTVLDPSHASHQPMHDPTGRYHLAFNGEVYNFREIRAELEAAGASFHTDGDTEVVLHACARWGVEALSRFNGMWALAFFDADERRGFLSRDRFGIKPLIYAPVDGAMLFASELRGLTRLGRFDDAVDTDALVHLLRYGYIPDPMTIHGGARRLEPGCVQEFDAAGVRASRSVYALPRTPAGMELEDHAAAGRSVRRAVERAVVRQRVSDVPIGAFLSGGLDSSIVVSHLASAMPYAVKTFCVGYAGAAGYDETAYARRVSRRYGTDHHELVLTDRDVLDAIPRILDHLGEPFGDSSIIPTSLISAFARRHVVVALSGDGGDELFGGYWRYLGHEALDTYRRIPAIVRRAFIEPALRRLASSKSSGMGDRVRQLRKLLRADAHDEPFARHLAWSRILAPEADKLFHDPAVLRRCDERILAKAERATAHMQGDDPLNRILGFDLAYQLPSDMLQKVDLASMMHSLEVRVPLLDHRVVERVAPLPAAYKVHRGLRKRILVDAYRGRLPDDVLDRGKQGFEVPIGEYLRGPLRDLFHDVVTRETVGSFGLLSYDAVEGLYHDHLTRRGEHADVLFALLSLCWWHRLR